MKKKIGITLGDPNGIGPEICLKSVINKKIKSMCLPIIIGSKETIKKAAEYNKINFKSLNILDTGKFTGKLTPGKISLRAGKEAIAAIDTAIELVKDKEISAITTAPICKEAIVKTGKKNFYGHTGYLAKAVNKKNYSLTLYKDQKAISFVTTHVSLKKAITFVKKNNIIETAKLLSDFLKKTGIIKPKIGICGLNPHAGENGLFGKEEIDEIIPAVKELNKNKTFITQGPYPPDVIFAMLFGNSFDGIVSLIHDHGHVAFKTALFTLNKKGSKTSGVNVTLGLPFIRTSVDHGTAFDIAWKKKADNGSMIDALELAVKMADHCS